MAASATLALKAGVWFRRGRLLIVSPDSLGTACPLSGRNSTYRPVQISAAGSRLALVPPRRSLSPDCYFNVGRGRMDVWAGFYERLFNFREIRYFDIKGEHTGLFSRALTSPDGKIRIPINETADEQSQIEE